MNVKKVDFNKYKIVVFEAMSTKTVEVVEKDTDTEEIMEDVIEKIAKARAVECKENGDTASQCIATALYTQIKIRETLNITEYVADI